MMKKSNEENIVPEFKQIISGYADDELRNVLKKRKLYQKEAADFAIQEAIRRGIIYSEQDLFSREFREEPEKFSLFPTIENKNARDKFKKSITRSLIILGIISMVWGGLQIFESQNLEGILIIIFGAAWSFTAFQLKRSVHLKLVYTMFFMLSISVGYLVWKMISTHSLTTIDVLVTAIAVGFIFYGIGFLEKLKD